MITTKQRIAFFKLVGDAWEVSGIGIDKDGWRRNEMSEAVPGLDSFKDVASQETYEILMLHFAKLAQGTRSVGYYATSIERRYRFVLKAVEADMAFFRGKGFDDAYIEGIYHQAGFPEYQKIDDIPAEHLKLIVQIADSWVRKLRQNAKLEPYHLPSAGEPWCIRGYKAAGIARQFAARRADGRVQAQTPVTV